MDKYIGTELELFEHAHNWKNYYGSYIKPLLGSTVAEIGAGIGGTTKVLCKGMHRQWLCVEPDAANIAKINRKVKEGILPSICSTYTGYSSALQQCFDSILYIDVIEHIEDDAAEINFACSLLNKGGRLFIIVPAHQFLFSPFDKMIGHFRRYNKQQLQQIVPNDLKIQRVLYLDSVGYFASLINRLFLKQTLPTISQVLFWDRILVPLSTITDKLFRFQFGKSILLIAVKEM